MSMTKITHTVENKSVPGHKVLILTGGLLTEKESSLFYALQKQRLQTRHSKDAWLDIKLKVLTLDPLMAMVFKKISEFFFRSIPYAINKRIFHSDKNINPPELTEVVLATHLAQHNIAFELATISELFSNKNKTEKLLLECDCVFFSTTFLRDLSELKPLIKIINRPHNHIVLGGALVGLIHKEWTGMEEVDVLAIGYGELLIPSLVDWMQSGFSKLEPPVNGSIESKKSIYLLYSGLAKSHDLDFLPRADWKLATRYYHKPFNMIYYESVRGCPYRCSFCNYPYLFDDNKFRYFSAERIVDDWEYNVKELGIEYITCLDSLFTMPKRRLVKLCNLLIERNIKVKWICYARADDLVDENIVKLMKRAGAHQVQIGIESGHPDILDNMDKRCTVEANASAIANCRKHGLTTVVSLIVGFPGETNETLDATYNFLKASPPDFYYLATFSTRATKVPILNQANRARFNLACADSAYTMAPYWKHSSMDCLQASDHVRTFNQRLMKNKISLNAVLFYTGILHYKTSDRSTLLEFQQHISVRHPILRGVFTLINKWINRKMKKDMQRCFPAGKIFFTSVNNSLTEK